MRESSAKSVERSDAWQRFVRNRLALVGLGIVCLLLVAALLAPILAPHDPDKQDLPAKRTPPGAHYLLGADEFGRDILSRVIYGSRVALLVGTVSVAIALGLGLLFGILSGYLGGAVDSLISRGMEILLAFPYLLLAIAVVSALGPGVLNTTLAVGIWAMPAFARIVRASVLSLKETDYVQAARAVGAPTRAILLRHILPNFLPTLIVYSTLYMANAILVEAALSFLGLGVQPPTASWGLMVATGRDFLLLAPHITSIPGLAIMLAVLGFNLLGDGLRDALDPRLRT
ncbi:MAG TPA: ABC transporter permease [Candidatus Methylomirabilis sp.]|nr:ABC transporter permease [Candidatus Methylomirabilis sp.]HSB79095.1 ABC transporter permease [Candidatus Methylomirabilis sp.]HSC71120.1 ABC transporter permease [Candidatus Methylomirabilis sp.]